MSNSKSIEYKDRQTPLIRSVSPRYGTPGSKITIKGRLFTKEYGNANFGDDGSVDNRREESVTGVVLGSRECELTDDLGNMHGFTLNSATSDEASLTCLPGGSFIGPLNGSVFVSGQYGKSKVDGAYSVNSKGQLFIYHTLPEVTSVSPNVGGAAGGTHVTIQGNSFDAYPGKTSVMLGSTPCTIVSISSGELVCSTPAEADVTGGSIGSRGLLYEVWTATEDATASDTSAADYNSMTMDGSSVEGPYFNETNGFTAKLSGYFIAPYTGSITFYLESSDGATLSLSTDSDPANKVQIVENTSGDTGNSDPIDLVEGEAYYIEAVHVQLASSAAENLLKISLWEHVTQWHSSQTSLAKDERQALYFQYDRVFETQSISFTGMSGDVTFTHAGKKAKAAVSTSSDAGWAETFTNMLTYSCTYLNTAIRIKQDYEDPDDKLPGSGGKYQDSVQAYCGARALENQERITHSYSKDDDEINAKKTPWLCFAAMGTSYLGRVSLRVLWQDNNDNDRSDWLHFNNIWEPSDSWSHQCIDMKSSISNANVSWIASQMSTKSDMDIQDIMLNTGSKTDNYYIDEVTFSASEVEIERKNPSLHNDNVMVNSASVAVTEDGAYDVSIVPWTCNPQEDDFELFGVDGATIVGLDTSSMTPQEAYEAQQNYLRTMDSATFTSAAWGSGTVKVERTSRGTRAVTGTFSLTYGGQTIDLPAYPTDKTLASTLESFGMVGVATTFVGERSKCYDTKLYINFAKSLGGDLEEMVLDATNLVVENEGLDTDFRVTTSQNGGLMIDGPGGDFFRLPASTPELSVTVEGFLANCASEDCSFSHDTSLTPTLASVAGAVVDGSIVLTITGSGFTTNVEDFVVMAGDLACAVTEASSTSITCTLEAGAAGVYEITVVVKSRGTAEQPGSGALTHEVTMQIFSNEPSEGSMGGGTTITVSGSGFPASVEAWVGGSVSIAGSECKVVASTFDEFQCVTSASGAGGRRKRAASEISVTLGSSSITGGSFNYDASLTPTVSSVSPTTSSPLGGDTLTITGTAFGANWGQVLLGDAECTIITWFPTEINCVLPPNSHGDYPVHVAVPENGYGDLTGVSPVSYDFVVTDMTPRKGSTLGGTTVKLTGSGFGDCSDIVVSFGEMMSCDIGSCTNTEITCVTKKNSVEHRVNNGGRHPTYGPGYVWKPREIEIMPGDTVGWLWNLEVSSEETGISVQQVAGPATNEYDGTGFKSEKSAKGGLRQVFDTPGTYYYSSQPVFGDGLFMKGTVKVVGATEDTTTTLSVTMGGEIAAAQQTIADTGSVDFGDCAVSTDASCVADPASVDSFEFTMAACLTPSVTSIDVNSGAQNFTSLPLEGFNGAELTIAGSGFSANSCQNVITIGDNGKCTVTSASATEIVCDVDGSGATPFESLKAAKINVNVLNSGSAILNVADPNTGKFNLVPKVSAVNAESGSWAGGNLYVLSGSGLVPFGGQATVFVTFGEAPYSMGCTIVEVAFDYISCMVPDFTSYKGDLTEKTVPVTVNLGYDQVAPILENGNITYTYDDSMTASATAMSPSAISTSETITISGENFGSSARVFLRSKSAARMRVRRAAPSRPEEVHHVEKREVNEFWMNFAGSETPSWRCMHGAACSHEEISAMSEVPTRYKRETDEHAEDYLQMEADDDASLIYDICASGDVRACNAWLNQKSGEGSSSRKKRAANEAELLEMALLTDGTFEATVDSVSATEITFTPPALPAGDYDVIINVDGQGNAVSSVGSLTSSMTVSSITPDTGSVNGGQTIVLAGSGFCETADATTVTVGGAACAVSAVTPGSITCVTPAGADGAAVVSVESCSVTQPSSYNYADASSPEITGISPTSASGATTIVITGSNFGSSPSVMVGSAECTVTASTAITVTCDLAGLAGGDYAVTVYNSDLGLSNDDNIFTSTLEITAVTPSSGSFGGGSPLVILGTGFDSVNTPTVTVCDNVCEITAITTAQIDCLTPANSGTGATEACDVVVTQSSGAATAEDGFTYDQALTPSVTSISPVRGGTGGGTLVTVTGTGFAATGNKVMIDGSVCDISTESATVITCYTNSHNGAVEAPVVVDVPDQGYAAYSDVAAATFYYIDRWSSIWTWGGLGTPLEGEFIVITEGQTILLDVSTPVLAFLLVKGGKLMFDGDASEIELQSEYILLVEGGQLEIGTEEEPYPEESKAMITMHGNVRCIEMPIFGCKVIGVRNGTLDLHGAYVPVTWTHLADTVQAGATEITLKQPVSWKVGDHIALATTSDRSSMKENEEHHIAAISADGYTITLEKPLEYMHISIEQTFGDRVVESRGEVALLTRNILIKGTMNEAFTEVLPACEQEFDSGGAFADAMQTCFAGKFGEELGSDEMGAIIIISPKYQSQGLVAARIEYTEFTNVGQAFRVGRYPIHFHLPGDVNHESYIRGNAIHHSNNRACTLHNVHNMLVEHNVAYSIKGLTFFLEDGIEEHNTLQYNLAIFTRMSNSLLNPDINPASFWIVNPNNKFRHNSCAGGTHFCFWLRPANVPDGPSWTMNYCPRKVQLDEFWNNTAHSMGWYGFWIFGQSNHASYDPHTGTIDTGYCRGERTQARFGSFTTWNNKRGFEIVSGANIRLENQTHMDHDFAAYEIFTAKGPYGDDGPGIYNSVIVGHSEVSDLTKNATHSCTPGGIHHTPSGYTVKDTRFYNFDRNCYCFQAKLDEHGTTVNAVRVEGLEFINSPNKIFNPAGEEHGVWFHDVDGSLTGTAASNLVGDSATNPPSCEKDTTGELGEANRGGHTGSVCPGDVIFHRMQMVGIPYSPSSFRYNPITVRNKYGNSSRPWGMMLDGWEAMLLQEEGEPNWITFDSVEHVTNQSYSMSVSDMYPDSGSYVLIGHEFYQNPDRFTVLPGQGGVNASEALDAYPTYTDNESGEWFYTNETESDNTRGEMVYILSDKDGSSRRKKRATAEVGTIVANSWKTAQLQVFRCFYENCIPPPPPTLPPGRPAVFHKWSNTSAWTELGYTMPVAGDTVFIPPGAWMVMDIDPPPLRMIFVYGGLEIMDDADHTLEVEIVVVQGGKFECGTQETPHTNTFTLMLKGDHMTQDQPLPNGPNLGAKALGVFGFADFHGQDVGVSWTKLAATSAAGSDTLELSEAVTWAAGSEVLISATGYELHETERRTIASVDGTTITLTEALAFEHLGTEATLSDGTNFQMRAEVGILTRNVRIVGNTYDEIDDQQFGGRVLVGEFEQDDITYTGFARFSNVEFAVSGQEGWYDNFDPRYALAFLDTGDSEDANGAQKKKESYVKKCAFNWGYNTAIGVFGSNNIPVEDNVIYRFINDGIFDEGVGNRINRNLVTQGESVSRLKNQGFNDVFYGCINIRRATFTELNDNVAAGCAQAGFITIGNPVENNYTMSNNEARTSQHGVHMDSYSVSRPASGATTFKDFYAWRNWDYGVYTQSENSIAFANIKAVDNGVGFLPFMFGPMADAHLYEDKYFSMSDSIFVGVSDAYDCAIETKPDIYSNGLENKRGWAGRGQWVGGRKMHHTAIVWPIFQSAKGKRTLAWHKPIVGAAGTNPALRGILNLSGVTFANFGENCDAQDVVFRTNFGEDDVNWPINATGITFIDTPTFNKVYVDEPILSKINPSDCTDFDCDGLKQAMIIDQDGSVAEDGAAGTIIPDAAFEWDGNPQRGLGDYRIPKPMVTELNGDRIEYEDKMPNKGLYRDSTCVWNSDWRAYKCAGINHRIMIIESMDRDSKIRRLGPLAMLANAGSDGYINLNNGPQDFSCCSGYICAERLSTFFPLVATGLTYEVMMTSIPPQNFRFHLLHNDGGDSVLVKMWFPKQQRLDVYVSGQFMNPNNKDFNAADYALLPPADEYIPAITEAPGSNYFDPNTGHLYLIVNGPSTIDIKTQPIVVLKLGMTVPIENFFEANVVGNLAGLLGIDPANIRVTKIVREGSVGRKKREAGDIIGVEFEIGPPPQESLGEFFPPEYTYTTPGEPGVPTTTLNPAYTTVPLPTEATTEFVAPEGFLDYEALAAVSATLVNAFQTGTLDISQGDGGAIEGMNITGLGLEQPIAPPEAPPPYEGPESRAEVTELTWAEQVALNNSIALQEYEAKAFDVPEALAVANEPEDAAEMQVLPTAVRVYARDAKGKMIAELGDASDPWKCTVSVLSGPGGDVMGTTEVDFVAGIATFDDIYMDQAGADYILQFEVSYPTTTLTGAQSLPFSVSGRPLGMLFTSEPVLVAQNTTFAVTATIWDQALDLAAESSVLSAFIWDCTATLANGILSGTTEISVAAGQSEVTFDDLTVEQPGLSYDIDIICITTDGNQTLTAEGAPFHVHDFPETGMLRKTETKFTFKGPLKKVEDILASYVPAMGSVTCEGCPAGMVGGRRKRSAENLAIDMCVSPLGC